MADDPLRQFDVLQSDAVLAPVPLADRNHLEPVALLYTEYRDHLPDDLTRNREPNVLLDSVA